MTEEEAKTKWCPFVRVDANVDGEATAPNRWPQDTIGAATFENPFGISNFCIASSCMAWRQVETEEATTTLYEHEAAPGPAWEKVGDSWDADPHKLLSSEQRLQRWRRPDALGHGFCGLAGRP